MNERRLGREVEVLAILDRGRTSLKKMVRDGEFPPPITYPSGRTKYWDLDEVQAWVQERLNARRKPERQSAPEVFNTWYERSENHKQNADKGPSSLPSGNVSRHTVGNLIHRIGR